MCVRPSTLIILPAIFLSSAVVNTAHCQTPNWVKEFRRVVKKMSYRADQPSLDTLLRTSHGNCVAFVKLGVSIAMRHKLIHKVLIVGHKKEQRKDLRHMLAVIHNHDDHLWCVSNNNIYRVKDEDDAIDWERATSKISDRRWVLKEKQIFTKRDLD